MTPSPRVDHWTGNQPCWPLGHCNNLNGTFFPNCPPPFLLNVLIYFYFCLLANPFQPSAAFHTKTSHLFYFAKQWLVSKWNTTLDWNELSYVTTFTPPANNTLHNLCYKTFGQFLDTIFQSQVYQITALAISVICLISLLSIWSLVFVTHELEIETLEKELFAKKLNLVRNFPVSIMDSNLTK